MKILFIGDIFGSTGRRVLSERLKSLREELSVDLCIANGENSAGGIGITSKVFKKLRKYGVDFVTGGNHSFAHAVHEPETMDIPELLRPLNYPPGNAGHGSGLVTAPNGIRVGVVNLQGRTFLHEALDCPFRVGEKSVEQLRESTPIVIVDFHAEATSEKTALAHHLDGSASAVIGTHTHVQTADERVLAGGTAYITDAGMTGPENSVIGMKKGLVLKKFLLQGRVRLEPARTGGMLNGVVLDIDEKTGKTTSISRVFERFDF